MTETHHNRAHDDDEGGVYELRCSMEMFYGEFSEVAERVETLEAHVRKLTDVLNAFQLAERLHNLEHPVGKAAANWTKLS